MTSERDTDYAIDPVTLRAVPHDPQAMAAAASALAARAADDSEPVAAARAASRAGLLFAMTGDVVRGEAQLNDALSTWRRLGATDSTTVAEIRLAQVHQLAGRLQSALDLLASVVARCRSQPELRRHLDFGLQHRGKVLFELGRHADALDSLREALALRVAKADDALVASTGQAIAVVEEAATRARYDRAAAPPTPHTDERHTSAGSIEPPRDGRDGRMKNPDDEDVEPSVHEDRAVPGGPYFGRLLIVLLLAVAFCGFMTWLLSTVMTD